MANQMTRELLEEMENTLSKKQGETLCKILKGIPAGDIAKKEEIHPSTISHRISTICKAYDAIIRNRRIIGIQPLSNFEGESFNLNDRLITLYENYMSEKVNRVLDEIDEPHGSVPSESRFYVERPPLEDKCKSYVVRPRAVIRISAPRLTGKTSLMNRVLDHAAHQGLRTVSWDLSTLDRQQLNFNNIELFLKCFCQHVTRQLEIEECLFDEWDSKILSYNMACTEYFEKHILPQVPNGLVIGLDNLDLLFNYQETCNSFLGLLRGWCGEDSKEWQRIRLLISHSTEDYSRIDVNESPFNIGIHVDIPEFTKEQMIDLSQRHGLTDAREIQKVLENFWSLAEGHPYLQRLWMYHVTNNLTQCQQIYESATTCAGIYSNHLQRLWKKLDSKPELKIAMKEVIAPSDSTRLNPELQFHLKSLGLIKYQGNRIQPYCRLYLDYFDRNLN